MSPPNSVEADLSPRVCVLRWNWTSVLLTAFLVVYGYFGARTPPLAEYQARPALAVIQLCLLGVIVAWFALLARKSPASFEDSIRLERSDAFVFLSYLAILLAGSFERLQFSLFSDELFFSQQAVRHALVLGIAAARFAALETVPFQYVVQAIAAVIILGPPAAWLVVRRCSPRVQIVLIVSALLASRMAITAVGGNLSPHPSLNLLSPLVFGALFGINDFAFKLSYFIPFTVFVFAVYRLASRRCGRAASYLFGLAVGTLPLLWHLGGIVEPSLWGGLCLTLVLLELLTSTTPRYARLMSIIAVAALMRQPAIIAAVPVFLLIARDEVRSRDWSGLPRLAFVVGVPLLLCVPFLVASVIYGTPSTPALGQSAGTLARLGTAVTSGIIVTSVVNSVPWWWIALIPFAFVPLGLGSMWRAGAFLAGAGMAIVTYYSISPHVLGLAKYQAEYAVPFAIAGALCLVVWLTSANVLRRAVPGLLAVLVAANVVAFMRIPEGNKPVDVLVDTLHTDMQQMKAGYRGLCAFVFDLRDGYREIKQAHLSERTYSVGWTYGVLPEIMNGYSTGAMRTVYDIAKRQAADKDTLQDDSPTKRVDAIERDPRIGAVLLGAMTHKADVVRELTSRGWRVTGEYKNDRYGSTVVVAHRLGY